MVLNFITNLFRHKKESNLLAEYYRTLEFPFCVLGSELYVDSDNMSYAIDNVANNQGSHSWNRPIELCVSMNDNRVYLLNGHHRIADKIFTDEQYTFRAVLSYPSLEDNQAIIDGYYRKLAEFIETPDKLSFVVQGTDREEIYD